MTQVIVDIQECSIICSYTSGIVNGWLVGASTGFAEIDRSLSCYIYQVQFTCVWTSWRYSGWERCIWGRWTCLMCGWVVGVSKESQWKLKWCKQHDAFDQQVNEMPYRDSMKFWGRGRLFPYGIKKSSSPSPVVVTRSPKTEQLLVSRNDHEDIVRCMRRGLADRCSWFWSLVGSIMFGVSLMWQLDLNTG